MKTGLSLLHIKPFSSSSSPKRPGVSALAQFGNCMVWPLLSSALSSPPPLRAPRPCSVLPPQHVHLVAPATCSPAPTGVTLCTHFACRVLLFALISGTPPLKEAFPAALTSVLTSRFLSSSLLPPVPHHPARCRSVDVSFSSYTLSTLGGGTRL